MEVIRKDIKNLHLGVYPPNGRVRVAAPLRLSDEAVRLAVVSRLAWIRRRQLGFQQQERQSNREIVTGESHFFQGRRFRLRVADNGRRDSVHIVNNRTIELRVRPGTGARRRQAVLHRWYRNWLSDQIPGLIAKWEPKVGVTVAEVRIKRMKTRWGTCNPSARRIWLNLELAKKPIICLEYILVHEMIHILEARHTQRFRDLLDGVMPNWRLRREELNRAPLAHELWRY